MAREDAIQGEILPPQLPAPPASAAPEVSRLSTQQMQAAVADAAGATRESIAEIAGVSQTSIKHWRTLPEYQEEVRRLQRAQVARLNEPVARLKKSLTNAAEDAIDALREALQATDDHGHPKWSIRIEAATLLLKSGVELSVADMKLAKEATAHGPQITQPIQINVNTDKGPPPPAAVK